MTTTLAVINILDSQNLLMTLHTASVIKPVIYRIISAQF